MLLQVLDTLDRLRVRQDLSRVAFLCSLSTVLVLRQLINKCSYLGTLFLLVDLNFPSGTIGLCMLCRSAHIHNRVLESLLVVGPCETLGVKLLLKLDICLSDLSKALLGRTEFLLKSLDLGLEGIRSSEHQASVWAQGLPGVS